MLGRIVAAIGPEDFVYPRKASARHTVFIEPMSRPRKADGVVPLQRTCLPRRLRAVRFNLRPATYDKLLRLGRTDTLGRTESAVATVERLIQKAYEELLAA